MEKNQGRQRQQPLRRTGEKSQNCRAHSGACQQVCCEKSASTDRARKQTLNPGDEMQTVQHRHRQTGRQTDRQRAKTLTKTQSSADLSNAWSTKREIGLFCDAEQICPQTGCYFYLLLCKYVNINGKWYKWALWDEIVKFFLSIYMLSQAVLLVHVFIWWILLFVFGKICWSRLHVKTVLTINK